ncbi:MAG: PAS domain S-box protein [Anaerolineae bacterium]|nr:PAS domain S-box protein [Anaerolineae bacterium]
MGQKTTQPGIDWSRQGREAELLHALNAAAASLQRSAHSEAEVFDAFKEQIARLGLNGSLGLFDETGKQMALHAIVYPGQMEWVVKFEKMAGLKAEGYVYNVAEIEVYQQITQTGEPIFSPDSKEALLQMFPVEIPPAMIERLLKVFGSFPCLYVPLIAGGCFLGVMFVAGPGLTPNDIPAMEVFANHLAIALTNARLFAALQQSEAKLHQSHAELEARVVERTAALTAANEALEREIAERRQAEQEAQQRTADLALINALNEAINRGDSLSDVILLLSNATKELFSGYEASVYLLSEDKKYLVMQTLSPSPAVLKRIEQLIHIQIPPIKIPLRPNGPYRALLQNGKPRLVNDPAEIRALIEEFTYTVHLPNRQLRRALRKLIPQIQKTLNVHGVINMPLVSEGEVIGLLDISSQEPLAEIDMRRLEAISGQLTAAIKRKQTEDALRQSEAGYRMLFEQNLAGVYRTTLAGRILECNQAFAQILGYDSPQELIECQATKFYFDSADRNKFIARLQEQGTLTSFETYLRRKDGTPVWILENVNLIKGIDPASSIIQGTSVDITDRKQAEEQMRRQDRLVAVGQLAGGIAHDFNNLLTAINGFAALLKSELSPDDPLHELAEKILSSGRRAADLVRQLLIFSRKQLVEPQVVNLNNIVLDLEKMLRRIIGEDIQINTILASDLWPIEVDPTQIEQVIVNLVVNARDAMPQGGQLIIETANTTLNEAFIANHQGPPPGDYVLLTVSDTGMGMSAEVKERIFEPFFTTKEVGQGTGLGLAMVYGIVKQSGGDIWVYSEEGLGATFKIYLPRVAETRPLSFRPDIAEEIPRGDETILLVEDDPVVRLLAQRVLQECGYTLLEAKHGSEALDLAVSHAAPIHLLLTDVIMPTMSGKALAEALAQTHPNLKTLFMSGYPGHVISQHGILDPDVELLPKPFSPLDLARKVRAVLDG